MTHEELERLTHEYGGDWAINHAKRILHLVSLLGEGTDYDHEVIWVAAHIHDWGGYAKWAVPGVEHDVRSTEIAKTWLPENGYPEDFAQRVIECIEFHHGGDPSRSIESILFTDADALDIIGIAGTIKCFSMLHRNLAGGVAAAKKYRDLSIKAITLDASRKMAEKRLEETNALLSTFEEETFGYY